MAMVIQSHTQWWKRVEDDVSRFIKNQNGAVRHGAECFNYGFPQELDD